MNDYGRMTSGLAREYMNYVYSCSADRKEARSKIDRLLNIADVFGFSFDQLADVTVYFSSPTALNQNSTKGFLSFTAHFSHLYTSFTSKPESNNFLYKLKKP